MFKLLSDNSDSKKLEKAWSLDQQALFNPKPDRQKKLWSDSVKMCLELLRKYNVPSQDRYQILSKLSLIYKHQLDFKNAKKITRNDQKRQPKRSDHDAKLWQSLSSNEQT